MDNRPWYCQFMSASRLDEYQLFLSGYVYNFGENYQIYTPELFIDRLLKIEKPSLRLKADAGTAAHLVLENAEYNKQYSAENYNGWSIIIDCDCDVLVPVIRESWIRAIVAGNEINGKLDGIDAFSVYDHKFTSKVDIEKYIASLQWKMYLLMTNKKRFVYNIFQVNVNEEAKSIAVQEYVPLILYSYDGMKEEVEEVVIDYKEFLLSIESMIINRVNEYNSQITQFIEQLKSSPIITAETEINQLINNLQTKYLTVKGLTDGN